MFVAVERSGKARAGLIASRAKEAIGGALRATVNPGARLISDGLPACREPGRGVAAYDTVDHVRRRIAEGVKHVHTAEAFFSTNLVPARGDPLRMESNRKLAVLLDDRKLSRQAYLSLA